jgi:hypothetical protein
VNFYHAILNSGRVEGREKTTYVIMIIVLVYSNNSSLGFGSGVTRHLCSLLASPYAT